MAYTPLSLTFENQTICFADISKAAHSLGYIITEASTIELIPGHNRHDLFPLMVSFGADAKSIIIVAFPKTITTDNLSLYEQCAESLMKYVVTQAAWRLAQKKRFLTFAFWDKKAQWRVIFNQPLLRRKLQLARGIFPNLSVELSDNQPKVNLQEHEPFSVSASRVEIQGDYIALHWFESAQVNNRRIELLPGISEMITTYRSNELRLLLLRLN